MTAGKLVPLSGIVTLVLVVVSFIIAGEIPDSDAPVSEVASFYTENDDDQLGSGILLGYGALFFLFFATALRNALRRAEAGGAGASTLAFGGAILFAAGMLLFSGLAITLGDSATDVDPSTLQTLHVLNANMFAMQAVGAFAFLLGTGIAVVKTAALPAWLGWPAIVGSVFAMSPLWFVSMIVLALLLLIGSVLLYLAQGTTQPTQPGTAP